MSNSNSGNGVYIFLNGAGVASVYTLLSISLWIMPVSLPLKGFWGVSVLLLTLALVNLVKYRYDERANEDRIQMLESAKNERLLEEYVVEKPAT